MQSVADRATATAIPANDCNKNQRKSVLIRGQQSFSVLARTSQSHLRHDRVRRSDPNDRRAAETRSQGSGNTKRCRLFFHRTARTLRDHVVEAQPKSHACYATYPTLIPAVSNHPSF